MKQKIAPIAIAAFLLAACDESTTEVTQVVQDRATVVADASELPECAKENEGEQALVTSESALRVCANGEWLAIEGGKDTIVVAGDTVFLKDKDFSCKAEELADKSGL